MPVVTLEPAKSKPPALPDFGDPEQVLEYERAMRHHRAHVERWEIRLADSPLGPHAVRGEKGAPYLVDLVDRTGARDACTCPDFLGNRLGTCKHIGAMHRLVERRAALRNALPSVVAEPTVGVNANGPAGLVLLGAWAPGLRKAIGDGARADLAALESVSRRSRVRVLAAARMLEAYLRARRLLAGRAKRVGAAIARGALGLDVLQKPLFPYQRDGVAHLVTRGRALLADDMGLGKTVQTIAACEVLRARGEAERILIVTPASLKDQWAREIADYAGQTANVIGGDAKARRAALRRGESPYTVLNYELAMRDLDVVQALEADVLVLDEAQRAKNFRTKTATTLRKLPSQFLFVLTGTPVENRLDDLYSLLQLADPAILGPLWSFNQEFHVQNERGRITAARNLGELRKRIAPYVLRRRKDEVLHQLPAITEQTRHVKMLDEQSTLENGYRADAMKLVKLAERRPLSPDERERLMMLLLKARQACDALALCDDGHPEAHRCPKLDELEALVSEICAQGASKILVFSEWTSMLELAKARLEKLGIGCGHLHGGVPTERRPALLARFREDPDQRVLLSTDAGGVGLNLQVASYVIHLDLPWNPGKLDQRNGRAHRVGQTHGVSVTYLVADDGIERGIEGTLASKRALRGAALDAGSEVDEVEARGFNVFLAELRELLDEDRASGNDTTEQTAVATPALEAPAVPEEEPAAALTGPSDSEVAAPEPDPASVAAPRASLERAPQAPGVARARDRLRLSRVVLDAGFHDDAVRAAYDALAAAIAARTEAGVASGHAQLVAAIYRELLPSARLPPAAAASLARLRDLALLRDEGVDVPEPLARGAVEEAEDWVARLECEANVRANP
jgi:superfamily II DNA or RNA helicase